MEEKSGDKKIPKKVLATAEEFMKDVIDVKNKLKPANRLKMKDYLEHGKYDYYTCYYHFGGWSYVTELLENGK